MSEAAFPFFTVIVLVTDENAHLLPFTLESLAAQNSHSAECILVSLGMQARQKVKIDPRIPNLSLLDFQEYQFPAAMNMAIEKAQGHYLHFLSAGEFYLSHQALSSLEREIVEKGQPSIAYTGQMMRTSFEKPKVWMQPITRKNLRRGNIPTKMHAFWFSREALIKSGGFGVRFHYQSFFDLVCRLFLSSHFSKQFLKRVMVDYDYQKEAPRRLMRSLWETALILWIHFGITLGFFQWIARIYAQWQNWMVYLIRRAFLKKSYELK